VKLIKIKPSLIKWPELRVTARFDDDTRQLLRDSITKAGILSPIIAQEIDGEVVGVDGLHRAEDAIALGDKPIDVAILDGDMADLLCRNLFLDHARGKTPVADMVKVIGALYSEYGLDPDQISERTGPKRDYIEKLIKISKASPVVLEALDQGVIGVGHAYELSRLPYAVQQEEIIAKHQVYKFTVKDLHDQIDQVLEIMEADKTAPPPDKPGVTRPAPVYHCEGCKGEVEPKYLRPVMLCPDCFGGVWRLAQSHAPVVEEKKDEGEGG
jgi:ParB-like chromosome segregation protein Spo0J